MIAKIISQALRALLILAVISVIIYWIQEIARHV